MCQNANKTAASLMAAIEPTLKLLLPFTGASAEQQAIVITEYDAALAAVQNWKQGTTSDEIIQILEAFDAGFNALPIPEEFKVLANIILAGIEAVIGVIKANSPAPAAPADASAAAEDVQVAHGLAVAHETTVKVSALVPTFKRSIFHSPESQYKSTWNKAVDDNSLPATLKV